MSKGKKHTTWMAVHTETYVGLRPIQPIRVYVADKFQTMMSIGPSHFLYHTKVTDPYRIYGTDTFVHVPRSLCKRARITVNIDNDKIIARRAMHTANAK